MFAFLQGKKTYCVALLLAVLAVAKYMGYVDETLANELQTLLIGGGLAALRASSSSSAPQA